MEGMSAQLTSSEEAPVAAPREPKASVPAQEPKALVFAEEAATQVESLDQDQELSEEEEGPRPPDSPSLKRSNAEVGIQLQATLQSKRRKSKRRCTEVEEDGQEVEEDKGRTARAGAWRWREDEPISSSVICMTSWKYLRRQ